MHYSKGEMEIKAKPPGALYTALALSPRRPPRQFSNFYFFSVSYLDFSPFLTFPFPYAVSTK